MTKSQKKERVVVALSGGVDSSVAALLCHSSGAETIGVSMQVWDYRQHGGSSSRATCCAPSDFCDARMVASKLDIPFYVFDFEDHFREKVINKFIRSYQQGQTPNPCVDCNHKVKFSELRNRAQALGFTQIATGHYARIVEDSDGFHLLRGNDLAKDQSYFLYNLRQEELPQTLFPVGEMTKPQVRDLARKAGLVTAEKAESQDICFVAGTVDEFLVKLGSRRVPGRIVDQSGKHLADHENICVLTVGQRKGLAIGGSSDPLYVLQIDLEKREAVVGPRKCLERQTFTVTDLNWVAPRICRSGPSEALSAIAQLRHRHAGVPVKVRSIGENVEVEFSSDWAVVTPGQATVFYDPKNQEVLGGGRVSERGRLDRQENL